LISTQKSKGHNLSYTSIFIGDIPNQIAPLMERITTELNGKHNVVIDAAQISGLLKEIHFKGGW
jgi:5,10-methylene-tetrahydrofolate dehydrogenase/methenyl tetrahydrofolate cyclohydrolase